MKNAMQRLIENERAMADPVQRERYQKIYKEIIEILTKNKCTVSEALNILGNLRKGISSAETVQDLGINEEIFQLFK